MAHPKGVREKQRLKTNSIELHRSGCIPGCRRECVPRCGCANLSRRTGDGPRRRDLGDAIVVATDGIIGMAPYAPHRPRRQSRRRTGTPAPTAVHRAAGVHQVVLQQGAPAVWPRDRQISRRGPQLRSTAGASRALCPSGASRALSAAATVGRRMGDTIATRCCPRPACSPAARARAARRDDHARAAGPSAVRAVGRARYAARSGATVPLPRCAASHPAAERDPYRAPRPRTSAARGPGAGLALRAA